MIQQFITFIKYFTNLSSEKRSTLLLFSFVLLSGFFSYRAFKINEQSHIDIRTGLKQRLDTCEVVSYMLNMRIDSLHKEVFYLKIDSAIKSASKDIIEAKEIANDVKEKEKNIQTVVNRINKKVKNLEQNEN